MSEHDQARAIAERFLDAGDRFGSRDPDGDECVLARQFTRARERIAELEAALQLADIGSKIFARRILELDADIDHRARQMAHDAARIAELEAKIADDPWIKEERLIYAEEELGKATTRIAELDISEATAEWFERAKLIMPSHAIVHEAALLRIAAQDTLAEAEAKWNAERDGEEFQPDIESAYDAIIVVARAALKGSDT